MPRPLEKIPIDFTLYPACPAFPTLAIFLELEHSGKKLVFPMNRFYMRFLPTLLMTPILLVDELVLALADH